MRRCCSSFTGGADGGQPNGVIRDSAGNLYGTTYAGGTAGFGTVFELDTAGQETVLHSLRLTLRYSIGSSRGTQSQVYRRNARGNWTCCHPNAAPSMTLDRTSGRSPETP